VRPSRYCRPRAEIHRWAAADWKAIVQVDFWDTVNRQGWRVCELTQQGVGSRGFSRGRYTANEHTVHRFDRMVCEAYLSGASV